MAAMSQTHEVRQHLDEVRALRERLGTGQWQEGGWGGLGRAFGSDERVFSVLVCAQITLKRLQTLLFGRRRAPPRTGVATGGCDPESGADTRPQPGVGTSGAAMNPPRAGGHRPGYGRLGMATYEGAERVTCRHEEL